MRDLDAFQTSIGILMISKTMTEQISKLSEAIFKHYHPVVEFTRFISDHVCNIFDFAKLVFYRDKSRFYLRNIYGLSLR